MSAHDAAADRAAERKDGGQEDGNGEELEIPTRHDSSIAAQQMRLAGESDVDSQAHREAYEGITRNRQAADSNAALPSIDTALAPNHPLALAHRSPRHHSPASAGLHVQTNVKPQSVIPFPPIATLQETPTLYTTPVATQPVLHHSLTSPMAVAGASSSLRNNLSTTSLTSSLSPSSALPSPYLNAMVQDITPLPSPLVGSASPGPWRKASAGVGASRSRQSSLESASLQRHVGLPDSPVKRKRYGSLVQEATIANAAAAQGNTQAGASSSDGSLKGHGRNRSISDFVPEQLHNVRHRHVTFGPGDAQNLEAQEYHLHRETNFAAQRGLAAPSSQSRDRGVPTPPLSTSSVAESEDQQHEQVETPRLEDGTATEYLEIHCGIHNKRRKFRQLRQLGQGTFSKVMLATSEKIPARIMPEIEATLDPHKLVAVKIVQYGPAGGADEERIETSLKREVDMLREVKHPCISHLKACEYQETRALLVIPYSPGGDLFEFATEYHDALTPTLMQRMFAELVDAVKYLHANYIVHRDIKLENVLINLPKDKLQQIADPRTYPSAIITLTDLGLSRRIAKPPESPLLETRCGSEDYAAPELILGQGYDGRQTDAWALGVLLYALMEGRLPFDPLPGRPARVRNVHRIARVEWIWIKYGDADGDWDDSKVPQDLRGAREVVEGLLKKVSKGRLDLDQLSELPWVKESLQVELKAHEDEEDDMLV